MKLPHVRFAAAAMRSVNQESCQKAQHDDSALSLQTMQGLAPSDGSTRNRAVYLHSDEPRDVGQHHDAEQDELWNDDACDEASVDGDPVKATCSQIRTSGEQSIARRGTDTETAVNERERGRTGVEAGRSGSEDLVAIPARFTSKIVHRSQQLW